MRLFAHPGLARTELSRCRCYRLAPSGGRRAFVHQRSDDHARRRSRENMHASIDMLRLLT